MVDPLPMKEVLYGVYPGNNKPPVGVRFSLPPPYHEEVVANGGNQKRLTASS